MSVQFSSFAFEYLDSEFFTAIFNVFTLIVVVSMWLLLSRMKCRLLELFRFFSGIRGLKVDEVIFFRSSSDIKGASKSMIQSHSLGSQKFGTEPKLSLAQNSEGGKEMSTERLQRIDCLQKEDNEFTGCGCRSHILVKARKWFDIEGVICSWNDVGILSILPFDTGFWRLMRIFFLLLWANLNGDAEQGGSDGLEMEEHFQGCDCLDTREEKEMLEEDEEEEIFEECEGDLMDLEQEYSNAPYLELEHEMNGSYMSTILTRNPMKEEQDDYDDIGVVKGLDLYDERGSTVAWKNAIKKERELLNAVYFELEKERLAASSAANEAMSMIQRLQKEKSVIEMEARQYRCLAEHEQIYNQETIESLLDIIAAQEQEINALSNRLKRCRKQLHDSVMSDEIEEESEDTSYENITDSMQEDQF